MEGTTFRCPACKERFSSTGFQAHMATMGAERDAVFRLFVATHEEDQSGETDCATGQEIVPIMASDDRDRFGVAGDDCHGAVMACACGGSFCAAHTFTCRSCGRFACLRHRWSGRCPGCSGGTARAVHVPKYDVFSKRRSVFVRTYRKDERRPPWEALVPDDAPDR